MRLADEMDRLILAAVCDDFMTLEFIVDKLLPGALDERGALDQLDTTDLQSRLLSLIADKLICAYLLHAEPPFITPIQIDSDGLPTSWLFITQRGKKCLSNSGRKHIHPRSDSQPGEAKITSAINCDLARVSPGISLAKPRSRLNSAHGC